MEVVSERFYYLFQLVFTKEADISKNSVMLKAQFVNLLLSGAGRLECGNESYTSDSLHSLFLILD